MQMTKEMFYQILYVSEIDPEHVRLNYSGRYMYGKKCPGITGSAEFGRFMAAAGIIERDQDDNKDSDQVHSLELADDVVTDDMAGDTIFYFPGLELTGESKSLERYFTEA
jgi:hypothetical protein